MRRTLMILAVVLLSGLFALWLIDTNTVDLATAAFHSSAAAPVFPTSQNVALPENRASIHSVVQAGDRTAAPGGAIVPNIAPSQALLPKFPAETAMPADLLQSQKLSATPSPLQSFPNTFEGRMGKLNLLSRTNALPPPPSAPPEMQMLGRMMAPPNSPPRLSPTIQQLRGLLLAQPGGREMLEEAKRRGFRLSQRSPDDVSSSYSLARLLMPAEVQAAEGFKAVFTPKEPKNSGLTFTGIWLFDPYRPVLDAGIHYGSPQGKTWAVFNVNVPREGMYWVTVSAFASNVKATLVKAGTIVKQFDYGPGANVYGYWAFVHLAPGFHPFYWYVDRGTAEFIEASVQEDL
jgi:hypothetical protein